MHPLTARAFGFPRPIAHGMWTKARCLAPLEGRLPGRVHGRRRVPPADPAAGTRPLRGRASAATARPFALRGPRAGVDPPIHLVGELAPAG